MTKRVPAGKSRAVKFRSIQIILLISLWAAFPAETHAKSKVSRPAKLGECPSTSLAETPEDCPWAALAREMIAHSDSVDALMKGYARSLEKDLKTDSSEKALKDAWGEAINYDEYAKGIIVEPAILNPLTQRFQVAAPRLVAESRTALHAGLQHSYAYLFSNLKTPFGYKRARWVKNDIEAGFGFAKRTISANPKSGSLFRNVTALAMKLSGQTVPASKAPISQSILALDVKKLKRFVLRETIETEVAPNSSEKPAAAKGFIISTYLIEFPRKSSDRKNTHLLVYTLAPNGNLAQQKLITAFPVESSFKDQIADATKLGDHQPIQLRYNAFHADLYQKAGFRGRRVFSAE